MQLDWQSLVTLALVALATTFVLRTLWKAVRGNKSGNCGSCGTCGSAKDVVTIDVVKRPVR
jgi:hypothetical protein